MFSIVRVPRVKSVTVFLSTGKGYVASNATSLHPHEPRCRVYTIHSPSPFNCSGVLPIHIVTVSLPTGRQALSVSVKKQSP
jgi:phage baseplate assembly protein W